MREIYLNAKQINVNRSPLIVNAVNIGGHYFDSRAVKMVAQIVISAAALIAAFSYSFLMFLSI